jgi:hypothetical protein
MKKRLLYISCMFMLAYFGSSSLKAQVVVGKDVLPESYSLLQVEYDATKYPNGAGIQLPRISESERTALQNKVSEDTKSVGLTIFNTTTSRVEYWNGREWVAIPGIVQPSFTATSGLNDDALTTSTKTVTVKLGGTLGKPTDIALSEKSFTIDQQGTARLEIGPITVKDNKVGIGVTTLTGGVDEDPTARLHIEKDASQVHGLRISDGSEGINKVMTALDTDGRAQWDVLDEVTTLSQGTLKAASTTVGYTTSVTYTEISTASGRVSITPGRWLIIGRFMSLNSAPNSNYYSWAKLADASNPTGNVYAIAGMKTEPGGLQYSILQVFYFGDFSSPVTIGLYAAAPNRGGSANGNSILGSWGGVGFLHAIKLADL